MIEQVQKLIKRVEKQHLDISASGDFGVLNINHCKLKMRTKIETTYDYIEFESENQNSFMCGVNTIKEICEKKINDFIYITIKCKWGAVYFFMTRSS
jgi:hypothetical protein